MVIRTNVKIEGGLIAIKNYKDWNRDKVTNVIYSGGDFNFKLEPNWAKFPEELKECTIACGCCDIHDNLYITTRCINYPIIVFDNQGNYIRSIGRELFSENLHGIFATVRNTLLCTDANRHIVREISIDGKLIRDFGSLDKPSDTGYEENVHKWLRREFSISSDVLFKATFELNGKLKTIKRAGAPFNKPTRMIESAAGEFFATDGYGNAAIHKFDANGFWLKTWGGPGDNEGEFRLPHGLWIDKKERLWVADRENCRVQIFSTDGELIAIVGDLILRPAEIWSNDVNVFVGEVDGGITILDMQLNIVSQIGYRDSPLKAHGLCGDSEGNLYIQTLWFNKNGNVLKLTRV